MSTQQQVMGAAASAAVTAALPRPGNDPHQFLQELVDQAASFNLFVAPELGSSGAAVRAGPTSGAAGIVGIAGNQPVHRFGIALELPSTAGGVRASNVIGEVAGRLELRWLVIPFDYVARPDREPPPTALDPDRSQRFVIQTCSFSFGNGADGFRAFGTGRTFPMASGGRRQLVAAAVGDIVSGSGKLSGREGNFTLCGEITPERGFVGHVMVRILDPDGALRHDQPLPPLVPQADPDPQTTYLTWIAQKGTGPDQQNYFSLTPRGEVRGANIPVALRRVTVGFTPVGGNGLRCSELGVGAEIIGREIGFGRETRPRLPGMGTPLTPFQFEGVSEYSFYDVGGGVVGTCKAVFLEGRSFAVDLAGAPGEPALRFGYFGAFVGGTGALAGIQGMLYGAAGSVFRPPPADHVISNHYVARILDPEARFRAAAAGGGR